jgi:hypothetical protein
MPENLSRNEAPSEPARRSGHFLPSFSTSRLDDESGALLPVGFGQQPHRLGRIGFKTSDDRGLVLLFDFPGINHVG